MSLYKHSQPPPKQCNNVASQNAGKVDKNSYETLHKLPKHRTKKFPNGFCVLGYVLLCQHNVDWKRVTTCKDHLRSKTCVKTRKNTIKGKLIIYAHVIPKQKNSLGGKKTKFGKIKQIS